MAINDIADQYYTYESRLASFQSAQQLAKRRTSNANSKAPKSIKWPHKFLSPEELAKAGFFYYPLQANPDNVACFLCHKFIDGWESGDDPLVEHLTLSPACGWAIVATIEMEDGELSKEDPSDVKMMEARRSTFGNRWPHENKKGWKCKTKQMVDAGWKYTPTSEYDDMATCTYCALALDGWEPSDKPLDEHFKRSPNCNFFALLNSNKQGPNLKKTKAKRDRTSKVSRLSTQSVLTVASEAPSVSELPAEDEDSIVTTATDATATQAAGKKMGRSKKPAAAKGKNTKTKKNEAVEVVQAGEPEDDDFAVKIASPPKATRSRKRKSEEISDATTSAIEFKPPPAKRRATRTRGSIAVDDTLLGLVTSNSNTSIAPNFPKSTESGLRKGRPSTRTSHRVSTTSVASLRAHIPNDDEIDQALQADLERQLTDDEAKAVPVIPLRKATRSSRVTKADHAMFGLGSMDIDEAAIEAELEAMEVDLKPLPKAKDAKTKQPRKVSAKRQAATKKAAENEAEALGGSEGGIAEQVASHLDQDVSMQHDSPIIQPKRRGPTSRQPSRQLPTRGTRSSVLSTTESNLIVDDFQDTLASLKDDSGNETDASMASQSTIVRSNSTRRGSTMKNRKGGKKAQSRNIEEIVHQPHDLPVNDINDVVDDQMVQEKAIHTEQLAMTEPNTSVAPISTAKLAEEIGPKVTETKVTKAKGRPPKVAPPPATASHETAGIAAKSGPAQVQRNQKSSKTKRAAQPPRAATPAPKDDTPSQSPQSSNAENHPPPSKPSAASKEASTPKSNSKLIPFIAGTPASPSKRNVIAGLQSVHPWSAVDLDAIFLKSPGSENNIPTLTSPEKKMSVEEWIHHNAQLAEEKLRGECERMVASFEREGTRAMRALEGVDYME